MRLLSVLAFLGGAAAVHAQSIIRAQPALLADAPTNSSFAKADGTRFNIDGVTKYYAGSNSYWLAFQTNNADIDKVLDNFVSSGLKIFRIWGFNDVTKTPDSSNSPTPLSCYQKIITVGW
jgi:hypothetical protein